MFQRIYTHGVKIDADVSAIQEVKTQRSHPASLPQGKKQKKAMSLRYLLGISLDTAPSEGKKKKKKKSLFAIPGGRGIVRTKDVFAA